jgi:hypothetical protein
MSAAALGTGAVVVVAAGLGISIARTGDEGGVQPTAGSAPSSSPTRATPTASASPSASAKPAPQVRDDRHHSDVPGAGRTGSGKHPNRQPTPGPTHLPFTGSSPLPATTALGLFLAVAGTWTLVRIPSAPGEAPVVIASGALDRLRAPRRATA